MTETATLAPSPTPALNMGMRVRLSAMMFLQYAIWGLWAPILGRYLATLPAFQTSDGKLDLGLSGFIYMTLPIASIVGPFIGGQIADRYFAAQRFLSVSQILGAIIFVAVAKLDTVAGVFVGMLLYNLIYAPTIAITNSISFQHWPNDQFSKIRVWGSIGWIAIGWGFGFWMGGLGRPVSDLLYVGAALSVIYGLFALSLPHTPPAKSGGNPLAFLEAVGMLKNPAFAIMAVVSLIAAIDMQLYFVYTQDFLSFLKVEDRWIGPAQTAGQVCEMVMMLLLPLAIRMLGFRWTMAVGIAAWALRDFIFSIGQPTGLVLGAISLHGVGFAFFFTTIFMFTDMVAPKDIKSSAQSFLASVTIGCGMLAGSLLAGPIADLFGRDWTRIFLVPAVICGLCCLAFLVAFRPKVPAQSA